VSGCEFNFHCSKRLDRGFFGAHLQIRKLASLDLVSKNRYAVTHFYDFLLHGLIFVNADVEGLCGLDHLRHRDFVVLKSARGCISET